MKLLSIIRRKRKLILSPEAKFQAAKGKVNEAFIMFQQANDAISEANNELNEAVTQTDKQISSLENSLNTEKQRKQSMLTEIELNKKLAQQLEPFIK